MKKKKLNESIMKNLKEYVDVLNIYPTNEKDDIWLSGDVDINGKGYHFNAKVYQEPSEYGINGGKVSKLCIGDDEKCILNYDRGWDILDKMITPDILEDIVEALEEFRDENPYEVTNESLKEDFWNPGKYFKALQDMEDIDGDKWNSANQEERDKMVTPYLTNFWNKYKEEMTQADLDALFDDMEDSNYHTPLRVLQDIINKDKGNKVSESCGIKKKKVIKEGAFMVPENPDDGWGDDLEDFLYDTFDRVERVAYEVRNAMRGSYADFGDTPDDLVEELYSISEAFKQVADEIQNGGYEYIPEEDEELEDEDSEIEESCKGKKKKKPIKEGVTNAIHDQIEENIKRDIEEIITRTFEGTDFSVSVGDINLVDGTADVDVTAFGGDDENFERTITLNFPSLDYETALETACEDWMYQHSTPDSFYESTNPTIKLSNKFKTIDIEKKDNKEEKEDTDTIELSDTYKTIDVPKGSITATPSIARTINSKRPSKKISEAKEDYSYNLIDLRKETSKDMKAKFKEFYDKSIFTWEGMSIDDENLKAIVKELKLKNPTFYTYSGRQMDSVYRLSGDNAYPSDLTFLSIENYYDPMMKMRVGARWFDDIVDNNRRRG